MYYVPFSRTYIILNSSADIIPYLTTTVLIKKNIWLSFLTEEMKRLVSVFWPYLKFLF